ncbi:MAG: acyl-CoA dehydrogenase [Gammaproteobacteria bacterium]|nr:acyl-CoA dehydrogenase [Gammaproteobacteria bacterium]
MITIFACLILIMVVWCVAYLRCAAWQWIIAVALVLVGITSIDQVAGGIKVLLWLVFIAALPFGWPALRRPLFSSWLLPMMRKALPPTSQTEREALEAGTVWWDGDLFSGNPNWKKLHATPEPRLSQEELDFINGPVEELCKMLDDWHITEERRDLPPHVWKFIREQGFFGMIIPKRYGGKEFSALAHSGVVMKVASRSVSAAVTVMVPNSLGPAELLLHYGTEEQKNHYLPRLARGEEVPCFALTGPEAGSDAASIPDRGIVCKGIFEGREVLGIRVTWEKRYITLGPVATVLGLAFRLYDPDRLLGKVEDIGITCALIPTNTPGVNIGNRHAPLNQAFMNGPNWGKDVFIPMEWVIGGAARVGQGWRMLMECLAAGRSISLPALSAGAGKLVSRATGGYARIRKQFKTPIGRFEGVEEPLARIAAYTYMMDAARTMTAGAVDQGQKPSVISAIVKYTMTERMRKVVNDGMDVQGGSAICMGPRNFIGRIYQSIPISITVEGANILTRTMIIFGQGAIRCHPYVLREMQAVMNPDHGSALREFDRAIWAHVGFVMSNAARALWMGLTGARFVSVPVDGPERRYYRQVTRMSACFALAADVAMLTLGGSLKRREKLSGRLADVLSQLYLVSATLKFYHDNQRPAEDLSLLRWACDDALYQAEEHLIGLASNLPLRSVGWLLKKIMMPFGRSCRLPSDGLGHTVAGLILSPSPVRDRLTAGIFVPGSEQDALGRIESALDKVVAAEVVERKLREAVQSKRLPKIGDGETLARGLEAGIINRQEADTLRAAIAARRDVITVDDFRPDYWSSKQSRES